MNLEYAKRNIDVIIFLTFFSVAMPLLYVSDIVSISTISLWGRYMCFAIVALSLDLLWGYTGILCMCQAFFFCLGGYGIAMHMLLAASGQGAYGAALPDFMVWNQIDSLPLFWKPFRYFASTVALGICIPGLVALIFGFFIFRRRIKGVYFAIITQAFATAMWLLFLRNETMLGGTNGLTDFKTLLGFNLSDSNVKLALYILSVIVLALILWFSYSLTHSKFGKILLGIRDSESRMLFTAYRVSHYKLAVFVIAAVIASIAGMLYVPQTGIITPGRMDVRASIEIIIWVALGGRGNLKGAILGALLVNLFYSFFTSTLPGSWLYIQGILFVITVLYLDKGVVALLSTAKAYVETRSIKPKKIIT
ncbi:MAG: urea ABC transporter permease subunit UrtC [Bacteroidota bacterium]